MKKLAIIILAATALVPAAAYAEPAAAPGKKAGVSWKQGGARMGGHHRMGRQSAPKMRHHGNRNYGKGGHHSWNKGGSWSNSSSHSSSNSHSSSHSWNKGNRHHWKKGGHHGWKRHHNWSRIDRGFIVPHFWWAPQFQVFNWQSYGFAQPGYGNRWIRYYDDALLIDQYGRVIDRREGMNWDEYGDSWDYDDQGIPYYRGDRDDYYGEDEWAEGDIGPGGPPPVPPPPPCAQACPHSGYGYSHPYGAYGYGYGWMHGGMVTITETTVHAAAPEVITETVYVKDRARKKRRVIKSKPRARPGERG